MQSQQLISTLCVGHLPLLFLNPVTTLTAVLYTHCSALHSLLCSTLTAVLYTHRCALHSPLCSTLTAVLYTHRCALHSPQCSELIRVGLLQGPGHAALPQDALGSHHTLGGEVQQPVAVLLADFGGQVGHPRGLVGQPGQLLQDQDGLAGTCRDTATSAVNTVVLLTRGQCRVL